VVETEQKTRRLLAPGTKLGRYELAFPLARGGMAEVHVARLVGEGRFKLPVAIKVPTADVADDPRFIDMLRDEANLSSLVKSPYVVQTLDFVAHEDMHFLAMELVVGVSLRTLVRARRKLALEVPIPILLSVIRDALRGLAATHKTRGPQGESLKLIHRDVSPHNILVGVDGRTRLADFGIAHATQRHTHTATGEVKGKLLYFAPEQLQGVTADARIDVFALGMVAYEILTGSHPFAAENPLQIAMRMTETPIPTLASLSLRGLSPSLAAVLDRAMQRNLDKRFINADVMLDAFELAVEASPRGQLASEREVGEFVRATAQREVTEVERRLSMLAAADDIAAVAHELASNAQGAPRQEQEPASIPKEPIFDEARESHGGDAGRERLDLDFVAVPQRARAAPKAPAVEAVAPAPSNTPRMVAIGLALIVLALATLWLGPYRVIALGLFASVCGVGVWLFQQQRRS
jgi:serine/threonine-protein kinase